MKFSKYIWELYLNSPEGKAFMLEGPVQLKQPENFVYNFDFVEVDSSEEMVEDGEKVQAEFNLREAIKEFALDREIKTIKAAEELFIEIADEELLLEPAEEFIPEGSKSKRFVCSFGGGLDYKDAYQDEIISYISDISAGLHDAYPEFFMPYFFGFHLNKLHNLMKLFEIPVPAVPGKMQKRERALYYLEINAFLQRFRLDNNLSPKELNAFLYDFGERNIPNKDKHEVPEPSRVWFVIGFGRGSDPKLLDAANSETITNWQGKLEMRPGDIVIMYCRNPRSYIHSIWRVVQPGFNDPYFYHYSVVQIGQPVHVPQISFKEIANHPLLGQKSIVKGKFQGATGSTFSLEEYKALLSVFKDKGFDTTLLPRPKKVESFNGLGLKNEKDVEEQLVEPLLKKLGFNENEWTRQFPVRMGRGHRVYPDYVIGGNTTPGEETATALIEAKYHISGVADLTEAYKQANSYALRLQSELFMLADNQGIRIYTKTNGKFDKENFFYKNWAELGHPDNLHEVSLLFGKRVVDEAAS